MEHGILHFFPILLTLKYNFFPLKQKLKMTKTTQFTNIT